MDGNHADGNNQSGDDDIDSDEDLFTLSPVPSVEPAPRQQSRGSSFVRETPSSPDDEEASPPPARRRRLNNNVEEGVELEPLAVTGGPVTRARARPSVIQPVPPQFPLPQHPPAVVTLDENSTASDSSSSSDVEILGQFDGGSISNSPRFSSSESGSGVEFSSDDDHEEEIEVIRIEDEDNLAQANNSNNWRAQRLVRRNAIVLRDDDEVEHESTEEEDDGEGPWESQPLVVQVHNPTAAAGGEQDNEDDRTTAEEDEDEGPPLPAQQVNVPSVQQPTDASDALPPQQMVDAPQTAAAPASQSSSTSASATATGSSTTTPDDEDDSSTCLICCEPFTNSGPHRLTCLKCGHTYGKACIEKWLTSNTRCPQCNARASRRDVRVIYVKNLRALDTAERDRALEQLEKEKEAKRRLELELAKLRQKNTERESEINQLKVEYEHMRGRVGGIYRAQEAEAGPSHLQPRAGASSSATSVFYTKLKHLPIQGDCRVGVFNKWLNMVTVSNSCKSPLYVNGIHSIKRINLLDFSQSPCVPIHQKEIRDMAFSPAQADTLLTVGLDKRAVLTNCTSNVVIQSYSTESPLWSCTWNGASQYSFFIGSTGGLIQEYDLRRPNELLGSTEMGSDNVPIVRLIYINPSYKDKVTGLLIQKLNSIWYWGNAGAGAGGSTSKNYQQLPLEGPFVSVAWEPSTRHLLVTTRGKAGAMGRHLVCDLRQQDGDSALRCEVVESYENPIYLSKMTRSAIYTATESEQPSPVYVATNGANKAVTIWNLADKSWRQNLLVQEPVLDFIPCNLNGGHLLGTVGAESGVQFYKG